MPVPVLNKSNIAIKRTIIPAKGSSERKSGYNEPLFLQKRSNVITVKGQIRRGKLEKRSPTADGDDPQTGFYVVFLPVDLKRAGLWGNDDSTQDIKSGDIVVSFETAPSHHKEINAVITEVRPEAPDYFFSKRHLLIYVICADDPERN